MKCTCGELYCVTYLKPVLQPLNRIILLSPGTISIKHISNWQFSFIRTRTWHLAAMKHSRLLLRLGKISSEPDSRWIVTLIFLTTIFCMVTVLTCCMISTNSYQHALTLYSTDLPLLYTIFLCHAMAPISSMSLRITFQNGSST